MFYQETRKEDKDMGKKRLLLLGVLVFVLACLGGISCGGGGSPEGVVKEFFTAINNGEFDKAEGYVYPSPTAPNLHKTSEYGRLEGNIEKLEILDVVTETAFGTKMAGVKVKLTISPALSSSSYYWSREKTINVGLEKTDQGWRISYIL